jgi:Rv0623-like transcription factor
VYHLGKPVMKDQVHIRNAEAAHLARSLARQSGKTISEVVLEALRQFRPPREARGQGKQLKRWQRLLDEDRKGLREREIPLEELYDEATGLPK